jgi:hypothetical protein
MATEDQKRKAALSGLFPNAPAPKQAKLQFKKLTKDEFELKTKLEDLDHQKAKVKSESLVSDAQSLKQEIASQWGLTLPRPPPRQSKGGPKPKSEKWLQGLHDYLEDIIAGKFARPCIAPPLACPKDWDPKKCPPSGYQLHLGRQMRNLLFTARPSIAYNFEQKNAPQKPTYASPNLLKT